LGKIYLEKVKTNRVEPESFVGELSSFSRIVDFLWKYSVEIAAKYAPSLPLLRNKPQKNDNLPVFAKFLLSMCGVIGPISDQPNWLAIFT
jgi:hypothetical protein